MKTTQRRGHPVRVGHECLPFPSYPMSRRPSATRQEPRIGEDAAWLTRFNLGKEEVGGGWEKMHILGGSWVEYGNCQQLPALSHITAPCSVPPTGCREEIAGLVAASHAQNCHCCVAACLPPALSDAHSDSDDFHCTQGSLTSLTGIHSLPQTWHRSHTQEAAQRAATRDGMNISQRDSASQVLKYITGSKS